MSSKTETKSTNAYDAGSMSAFNVMTPQIQANWSQDMQLDPTKSSTYNYGLSRMTNAASTIAKRNTENFFGNMTAGGYSGNNLSGVQQQGLMGLGMGASSLTANAFNQNYMNYDLMRRQATAAAANYKPLQTGGTQTQTTSGVGTWLPQLAGAAIGGAMGVATGGMSTLAGFGAKSAGAGGGGGGFSPFGGGFGSGANGGGGGFNPSFGGGGNYVQNPFGSPGSVWH
jgi:hypothetical protein